MRFDDETIHKIEGVLGRPFDPEQIVRYESLNDIPASLIEETRSLPERLWFDYLELFAPDEPSNWYKPFFQRVVEEGHNVEWWSMHTGFSLKAHPTVLEQDDLDEVVGYRSKNDTAWYFSPLQTSDWQVGQHYRGAPKVMNFDRSYDYRWRSPKNILVSDGGPPSTDHLQKYEGDVRILLRRWFASILARRASTHTFVSPEGYSRMGSVEELCVHAEVFLTSGREPNEMIIDLYPKVQTPSEDARHALEGLLLEIADGGYTNNQIPGYVGPDTYYSESAPEQTTPTAEQFPVETPNHRATG